jgi:uncharacterized protein (DUF1330 family)
MWSPNMRTSQSGNSKWRWSFPSEGAEKVSEAGSPGEPCLLPSPALEQAVATYERKAYQAAVNLIQDAVVRDIYNVQGVGLRF